MKSIVFTILFVVLFAPVVNAQSKDLNEMGVKGMELVFNLQYDEANRIFDEMIRLEPENALGYFLKSKNNFWMYVFNSREKEHIEKFEALAFKTIDMSKEMLDKNRDNIDALFCLGTSYGFLGRWYGETGGWIKAFWYGRKGKKYLEKAIKKDHEYYDAYFALGVYHYYADVLPKFVKVVSFILGLGGDRERGLEEATLALSKGNFTRDEAKFFLAQGVYFEIENDFETALPLFEELAAKYPDNHNIKMNLALCYRNLSKYDLAVQILKNSIQTETLKKLPKIETQVYRYLGNTYADMNEFEKAAQSFETVLTLLESQERTKSWEYEGALYYAGDCYEMMGDTDRAHRYYSKVSKTDTTGAYSLADARLKNPLTPTRINYVKGDNFRKCGEYAKADVIFNDLMAAELNKEPLDKTFIADLNLQMGRIEYETKEYQNSIQTFRKILSSDGIAIDWIKPWSHYFLGKCYQDTGEFEKAKHEFDLAYKHEGDFLRQAVDNARGEME